MCSTLFVYTVPDGTERISDAAFERSALEVINIPDSVKYIGDYAFGSCYRLKYLSLPSEFVSGIDILPKDADNSELPSDILNIVYRGNLGEWVKTGITGYIYENVTFSEKYSGEAGDGDFITVKINEERLVLVAYKGGGGEIVIPDGIDEICLLDVSGAASPVTAITISAGVKSIDANAVSSLLNIYVVEDNPNFISVDGVLFSKDKERLAAFPAGRSGEYIIPDGTKTISGFGKSAVESLYLPDGIAFIDTHTFYYCSELKKISIPESCVDLRYCALPHEAERRVRTDLEITYRGNAEGWGKLSDSSVSYEGVTVIIGKQD